MIYLILGVVSSAGIFVTFKVIENKRTDLLTAIIINYLTASVAGFLINLFIYQLPVQSVYSAIPSALIIGVLFILMFFVVGLSTKHAGLTVTTLASKMSLIFPVMFSIFIDPMDKFTPVKTMAFILTFIAIALTVYKKPEKKFNRNVQIFLPVVLFLGMGLVDSVVKFAQQFHVSSEKSAIFSTMVFFVAFITGIVILLFKKNSYAQMFNIKNVLPGIVLGLFNYGSIFFIIKALNHQSFPQTQWLDSSIIFGLNNTGIVLLNTFIGYFYFKEHLLKMNWLGITLSLVVIYILSIA
jgi:drug/metabolite transporter (DMT)-like permease